jgi:lipid-A-disaccharide synthase
MPTIAIVAGEASGDLLGSHLISAIKKHRSDSQFFGIAGPKMQSAGAKTLYPIERLSVRGYIEVLKHLPSLLKLRRELLKQIIAAKPDLFIGVDAPDFNFWLEKKLKKAGIPTIHYVSPSIWAWRGGRIKSIKKAVSHMLALFPFEPGIYHKADIPVTFVGHPLADELPLEPDQKAAQKLLKIEKGKHVFALLPGSRQSEVQQHAALLIKTAQLLSQQYENALFLVPLITRETRKIFETERYKLAPEADNIQILFGHAHDAMEAADMVILASGTATLEAALLKRPMIITYKMPALSWQILKRMRYQPYVGLPNILAEKWLVPELLQKEATPEKLTQKCVEILENKEGLEQLHDEYLQIHYSLKQDSAEKAAQVVLSYL